MLGTHGNIEGEKYLLRAQCCNIATGSNANYYGWCGTIYIASGKGGTRVRNDISETHLREFYNTAVQSTVHQVHMLQCLETSAGYLSMCRIPIY